MKRLSKAAKRDFNLLKPHLDRVAQLEARLPRWISVEDTKLTNMEIDRSDEWHAVAVSETVGGRQVFALLPFDPTRPISESPNKAILVQVNEYVKLLTEIERGREALATILDAVDYTAGNCRPNEQIGAVLPKQLIFLARKASGADYRCYSETG